MSIPPPAAETLLPPLLACLPTAFASTRPPPALLPLLSPILRQRVQLLSGSSSSPSDSWLPKLSWDPSKAEELASVVESEAFELHPVSNEIEYDDVEYVGYRRLDEETLQCRIDIWDLGLTIIYLWCVGDTEGGEGWRVAEVLPSKSEAGTMDIWAKSIEEATEACAQKKSSSSTTTNKKHLSAAPNGIHTSSSIEGAEDDDDDYWAQYDNAPSSTPGPSASPGPQQTPKARHGRTMSDAAYFSQYSQIQPDMDNDDPSTDRNTIGESSLNGDTLASTILPQPPTSATFSHLLQETKDNAISAPQPSHTDQPRNSSLDAPASSPVVNKLEGSATMQSQTELAVRQHIASTMKSLYRLARSTGMEMVDFEKVISMEVEMLGFEEGREEY
ncbi:MAG: hypothetical protein LQ337_008208 [Flavoplaca oasis]|nr:MAG: hypothetical protein LQ337_008208 [Flavoplaca oasis]